jgi:hypothetical protein
LRESLLVRGELDIHGFRIRESSPRDKRSNFRDFTPFVSGLGMYA